MTLIDKTMEDSERIDNPSSTSPPHTNVLLVVRLGSGHLKSDNLHRKARVAGYLTTSHCLVGLRSGGFHISEDLAVFTDLEQGAILFYH